MAQREPSADGQNDDRQEDENSAPQKKWPVLLDEATCRRLRAVLLNPSRRTPTAGRGRGTIRAASAGLP